MSNSLPNPSLFGRRLTISVMAFLLVALTATSVAAQPATEPEAPLGTPINDPYLVKDIGVGSNGSSPQSLTDVKGTLFFSATDGTNGLELWKSDGTATGTLLVKDINPGSGDSNLQFLTNVNGTLFFMANDGTSGAELWKSDGTLAGTVLVKDISPGIGGSGPQWLTNVNGTLFFRANTGTTGIELWKSNGTAAGTVLVKDILPGANSSLPDGLTNLNGTLFFRASDGTNGTELWKSDGTATGTVLVKDIAFSANSANPSNLININGTLFFSANDTTNGYELWKSNGTTAGTVLVKDINTGINGSSLAYQTNVNGTLFFTADNGTNGYELWKSNGTTASTVLVKDIYTGSNSASPTYLTNINGTLFFSAYDATNGIELWQSDGTAAGTVLVKDIRSGSSSSGPAQLISVNGTLFFNANNGTNGYELWKSDGTAAGTVLVKDIYAGSGTSGLGGLVDVAGILFFGANDSTSGLEPWAMAVPTTSSAIIANGATTTLQNVAITNNSGTACNLTVTRYPVPPGGLPADSGEAGVYWQISTDCATYNFDLVFTYTDVDLARGNGVTETGLQAYRSTNGNDFSLVGGTVNTTANTVTVTGVTQLSWWALGSNAPLSVTLADFSAVQQGDAVLLTWETNSELENRGFNLYRGTSSAGADRQLNQTLIPSQSQGNPGGFIYTWEDRADLAPGTSYFYWVEDVDISGAATMHGPVSVDFSVPTAVEVTGLAASSSRRAGPTWPVGLAVVLVALSGATRVARRRKAA